MTAPGPAGAPPGPLSVIPREPAEVVVLGEALVDFFADGAPVLLAEAERFSRHLGGAGANLATGLCRQGTPAALCGQVGGDAFGHFLRDRLRREGVATDGLLTHRGARTGITFVSVGPRGERSFLYYGSAHGVGHGHGGTGPGGAGLPAADLLLRPDDLHPSHLCRGRLLAVGSATLVLEPGRAATHKAVDLCRKAGMLIACDLNFRAHKWPDPHQAPPLLRRLLGECDVVKLAQDDLSPVLGTEQPEAAAARVRQLGATVVVVTLGDRGCYLDAPAGQVYLSADLSRLVDRTGAGDAFTAGLLSVLLAELPGQQAPVGDLREALRALGLMALKRACARGNYLGARACTALGATTAVPRNP